MRSKLKILVLAGVSSAAVLFVSCDSAQNEKLPPVESEQGKKESAKLKAERDAQDEREVLRAKLQNAVKNLDKYTKEGLEKDDKMDPFVKNALLMAMKQKEERKKKREAQRRQLIANETAAGKLLDAVNQEKLNLVAADAAFQKIAKQQREREEAERAERNGSAPEGMVWVPGGTYMRGSSNTKAGYRQRYGEEFPVHLVEVDGFFMDATEVTNAQFTKFVKATGYKTLAEVGLSAKDFPLVKPKDLQGGANVFKKTKGKINPWVGSAWRWWSFTPGATWKSPEGPGSNIKDKMDHPVTCVNYDDAVAYAKWAGKRLPTEAEWERAARGGKHGERYTWGDDMMMNGKWMANVFQGEFPSSVKADDGYVLTSPAKSYPPNAWGLYDMAGNVWEICNDYYNPAYYHDFVKKPHKNPTGPQKPITDNERRAFNSVAGTCPEPREKSHKLAHLRVSRGGSFLCSSQYCLRFRPAARHHHEELTPSQHTGFRCVQDFKK